MEWIADGTVTEGLADRTVTEGLADRTVTEGLADGTAQKREQTWESANTVRHGSHQSESLRSGLRNEQTCGMTLASAYVLRRLSAAWSQLQMMGRSLR